MPIKLLPLTNADNGRMVAINADYIIGIFEQPDKQCIIEYFTHNYETGCTIRVVESFDEIGALVYDANTNFE